MRPLAAALLFLSALPAFADGEVVHRITAAAVVPAIKRITIAIPTGYVAIRNGAMNRVAVGGSVRLRYDGKRQQEMQQIVDDVSVAVRIDGDHATVYRTFGSNADSWRGHHM